MKFTVLLFSALFSPVQLWAAIPPSAKNPLLKSERPRPVTARDIELTVMALRLPLQNRLQALKSRGEVARQSLERLAMDQKQDLQTRWRSITALGRLYPIESKSTLEEAVRSDHWYLRNAGILALSHGPRDMAIQWAKKLLDDPALVVRTAAVQTLEAVRGVEAENLLWQKLNANENFHNGKSLWVRKHIARLLSHFAKPGQEGKFIAILKDQDERLHPYAVQALKKMTGQKLTDNAKSFQEQRQAWLNWWQGRASSVTN